MSHDDKFDKIAQETIEKANLVECNIHEYVAGLRSIISELQVAIEATGVEEG